MQNRFFAVVLRIVFLVATLMAVGCGTRPSSPVPASSTQASIQPSPFPATSIAVVPTEGTSGTLFANPDNPRYFTDGVKVGGQYRSVYLTGAHTWCNFMDCGHTSPPVTFDYEKYLDFLQTNNFNFFRLWRAENARGGEAGPDFWFDPMPYQRSDECCAFDGDNKFDLEKFNQAYFDRMRERVVEAGERGIYVSIMLFDGWSVETKFSGHNPWEGHPYKLSNNINNINGDVNGNGQGEDTHILTGTPVTALQEAYVRKVIDTVNDLDNVLYELSNESPGDNPATSEMDGSKDWQYHMIQFVKDYESAKPKQHPVGMTWEWLNGNNQFLYDSPADWISLGGAGNLDTYSPPVADGSKVILADTDHLCGICGNRQWVWKSFTRGENPIFMDIYDNATSSRGMPFSNPAEGEVRLNLRYVRSYADRMNLTSMTPQPGLCSTGYCLANASSDGAEYLMFLPAGAKVANLLSKWDINKNPLIALPSDSKVDVDLSNSPVDLMVEWFNPADGTIVNDTAVQGGVPQSFTAPFSGDAVLYIYDAHPKLNSH
jgi:hypothetical protein